MTSKVQKRHARENNILCQWCNERVADHDAHIIKNELIKEWQSINSTVLVPKRAQRIQKWHSTTGILCTPCDMFHNENYEMTNKVITDKLVASTLWKGLAESVFLTFGNSPPEKFPRKVELNPETTLRLHLKESEMQKSLENLREFLTSNGKVPFQRYNMSKFARKFMKRYPNGNKVMISNLVMERAYPSVGIWETALEDIQYSFLQYMGDVFIVVLNDKRYPTSLEILEDSYQALSDTINLNQNDWILKE